MDSNSSQSILSDGSRREINQYFAAVNYRLAFFQGFICISGLLGNLLALIVINRKTLRHTSSAVFITYLAIFDSAVLLSHAASLLQPRRNLYFHCSVTYLIGLTTCCANWTLVIITIGKV